MRRRRSAAASVLCGSATGAERAGALGPKGATDGASMDGPAHAAATQKLKTAAAKAASRFIFDRYKPLSRASTAARPPGRHEKRVKIPILSSDTMASCMSGVWL